MENNKIDIHHNDFVLDYNHFQLNFVFDEIHLNLFQNLQQFVEESKMVKRKKMKKKSFNYEIK